MRNIRDPGQQSAKEHQEHMTTHRPYRSWCKFCVMGRAVNAPHRRSDAEDDLEGVPHVSMWVPWREGIGRARVSCAGHPRTETQDDVGHAGSAKGTEFPWIAKRAARFIDQLGHNRVTLRCDNEPAIEAVARKSHKLAKKVARLFQRGRQWGTASPMESSSVRWDSCRSGQNTESCVGASRGNQSPT